MTTSIHQSRGEVYVELYLQSLIGIHGVVLSYVADVFMAWYLVKYRDNFNLP